MRNINEAENRLDRTDIEYLEKLSLDTWTCLNYLYEPRTGLPYDNIYRGEYTSVTNIGLAFAATVGAYHMGYIERNEAVHRLRLAVASLQKMKRWHGFCQSWNGVQSLLPSKNDFWISTLDTGHLVSGLLIARYSFHELAPEIDLYLDAMDWKWICDVKRQHVYGGYITDKNEFAGPLTWLGGDPRLACFLAIAFKAVSIDSWENLERGLEEKYQQQYLKPGWQGGGLFMQYISGLFVDEWASPLNRSAANFAYTQILHALDHQYSVWGWSASDSPKDGYLGWGHLKDQIITPHASILALGHYPKQVLKNLKRLETMGARAPFEVKGQSMQFGFRDAIDISTGEVTENYLFLDQGMIFLTLVNFLKGNILRKTIERDPKIKNAIQSLKDYQKNEPEDFIERLRLRDQDPNQDRENKLQIWNE